jgi:hypothetical protein
MTKNWIKISNDKFEIIKDFKYIGPLKPRQLNTYWSSTAYFSLTIKCPKNFYFISPRFQELKGLLLKENELYYDCQFTIQSVIEVSDFKDYKYLKLIVEDLKKDELPKNIQRDLKLTDLFEYNFS